MTGKSIQKQLLELLDYENHCDPYRKLCGSIPLFNHYLKKWKYSCYRNSHKLPAQDIHMENFYFPFAPCFWELQHYLREQDYTTACDKLYEIVYFGWFFRPNVCYYIMKMLKEFCHEEA